MDVEDVTDFKTLRAKFQNDSNLGNKLVQPCKKPPAEIPPKLGSGGNAVSSPLTQRRREFKILKPEDEPAHPGARFSVVTQSKPLAWPRAKLGYMEPTGHTEEYKGTVLDKRQSSPKNCQEKRLPLYCTDQKGSAQTSPQDSSVPNSFHHALRIWENNLSCSDKASAPLPTQWTTNLRVHPCSDRRVTCAPAASRDSKTQPSESEPVLVLHPHKKDTLCSSGLALPQAPRGHRSSDEAGAKSTVATAFCQSGFCAPRERPQHRKELEPPFCRPEAGKTSDRPGSKWPRVKPLPSAESLGPAPQKPPRPPKFDLRTFQSAMPRAHRGNETTADEEDYLTPKSAQLEEQPNYEEIRTYLNQSGDTTTLSVIEVPKAEPQEHKKQKRLLFAKSSPGRAIIEDEKEQNSRLVREQQEAKNIFKTGGNEYVSPNSQTKEDGRGRMKVLQVKQNVTSTQNAKHPTPQWLTKDRAGLLHYMHNGVPKPQVERIALNQSTWRSPQVPEDDIYDDVEEMQDTLSQASDASSLFASASISGNSYEETYEDVEIGDDNPAKTETENQKRFGNLFKIEKLKLNTRLKENFRLLSMSVPNIGVVSQEDVVYDDIQVGQRELREKDKHKTWMPKFLMTKDDKDQRKNTDDVERSIFKFKQSNAEKSKKTEKEEKFFRETSMHDKEISVINTATVKCSVPSKRRIDLPITAGEQLDVIDVMEGNEVICRNLEGRYGYVLVEHLNFRQC